MNDFLRKLAIEQIEAIPDHIRLIIIHPNFMQQHLLLDEFLKRQNTVYVRFHAAKLDCTDLQNQLNSEMSHQTGQTKLSKVHTLVLDECDRAHMDELDIFLMGLMIELDHGQIVIISREIPRCVLNNDDIRAKTTFIPLDEAAMLSDYSRAENEKYLLEVRAFGSGRVKLNGEIIDNWDGLLPRSLFFYLVDRGMATRNEIFETFWPKLSVREATNVFHVTKRKINEVLGVDLTIYWSGYYRISPDIKLHYDAVLFSEMMQGSEISEGETADKLLRRAVQLYRGPFLSTIDLPWTQRRRSELAQSYGEAMGAMAAIRENNGEAREALSLYLRAASINRQREDFAGHVMRLCVELDEPDAGLHIYEQLSAELNRTLKIAPAPYLQQLATTLRSRVNTAV